MVVVDDGSPDGTGALADRLASVREGLSVVHRPRKEGIGPAYAAGFTRALATDAEVVCEMDADFSHDPADLPRLVAEIGRGADLVLGSRYVPGGGTPDWRLPRRLLSWSGNVYARLMLGLPVRDATGGFRAFRAEALRRLDAGSCRSSGYAFQVEMAWRAVRAGMDVREVPIVFRDRQVGSSKMHRAVVLEAVRLVTKAGIRHHLARLPWIEEGQRWS